MTRHLRSLLVAVVTLAAVLSRAPRWPARRCSASRSTLAAPARCRWDMANWHAADPRGETRRLAPGDRHTWSPDTEHAGHRPHGATRRATIYAAPNPDLAKALMTELRARADAKVPLAAFDPGLSRGASRAEAVFKQLQASQVNRRVAGKACPTHQCAQPPDRPRRRTAPRSAPTTSRCRRETPPPPQPATNVNSRGPKSRAGLIAYPALNPNVAPISDAPAGRRRPARDRPAPASCGCR